MTQFRRMALGLAAAFGILALATPESAEAAFKLRITTNAGSFTITDNDAGPPADSSGLLGSIVFVGNAGQFELIVSTGRSKPLIGSAGPDGDAEMSLNIAITAVSGSTPDFLRVELTDTDFLQVGPGTFSANFSGSTVGAPASASSITYSVFKDFGNVEFGQDGAEIDPLGTLVIQAGVALEQTSGDGSVAVVDQPPYSMTLFSELTFGGGELSANYSVNAINSTNVIPEPGSIVMALSALPLMGCVVGYRRWRRREQA